MEEKYPPKFGNHEFLIPQAQHNNLYITFIVLIIHSSYFLWNIRNTFYREQLLYKSNFLPFYRPRACVLLHTTPINRQSPWNDATSLTMYYNNCIYIIIYIHVYIYMRTNMRKLGLSDKIWKWNFTVTHRELETFELI